MKAYEIGEQYYANFKDERLDKETLDKETPAKKSTMCFCHYYDASKQKPAFKMTALPIAGFCLDASQ